MILLLGLTIIGMTVGSSDGAYYAVVEYYPGTELVTREFTLYTTTGDMLYHIGDHLAHTYYVSCSGGVFAMNEHDLWFYDTHGDEQWHCALDGVNGAGFSSAGAVFYVSEKTGIHVYDRDGRAMYDLPPGRLFTSTEQGVWIATVSADTAYCFEDGVLQTTIVLPSPYAWGIDLTPDHNVRVTFQDRIETFDRATGTRREP